MKIRKRWSKEKVADAICRAVIRQNYCDENGLPLLVLDKETLSFLRWKYWLSARRVWQLKNWAKEDGLISIHPMSPTTITPDNAHIPDVYIINQEFYGKEIKPYLSGTPEIY
ncbi:MAG: hypothetical protein NC307_14500 [Roseburia sp.]|nr:hypothetical protein [Roseburia sp.]